MTTNETTAENPERARRNGGGARQFQESRRLGRRCALQLLYQLDAQQDWKPQPRTIETFWNQLREVNEPAGATAALDAARPFAESLVKIVAGNLETIDAELRLVAENWSLERMNGTDRSILRLATGELRHAPKTPAKTVINEAIELAKEFGDKHSSRFVNGVLDKLYRNLSEKPTEA